MRVTRWGTAALCAVALAFALPMAVRPSRATAPTAVPAQWIAKQYTELLGRAPTTQEWTTWTDYYADPTTACDPSTLAELGTQLAGSSEFTGRYPDTSPLDRAARVSALVRAAYDRDLQAADAEVWVGPAALGTAWGAVVDDVFGRPEFANERAPRACDPAAPGSGFDVARPLDLLSVTGSGLSRTQQQLQAEIDSLALAGGGTVLLQPGEVVAIGGPDNAGRQLHLKPGVTLTTAGAPTPGAYARMGRVVPASPDARICSWTSCNDAGIVALEPGASLRNVWVDGQGLAGRHGRLSNVETLGSTPSAPTVVTDNRVSNPGRDGTAIHAHGFSLTGQDCANETITGNLVTGYAAAHELDRLGRRQAADGIEISCESTTVQGNTVVDVPGVGLMLYGSINRELDATRIQRSQVTQNSVVSVGLDVYVAIGADPTGECFGILSGPVVPCLDLPAERSFQGATLSGNTFWTGPRTQFHVGLLVGGAPLWGGHRVEGTGASFQDNTTGGIGARVNMGISVLGMNDATLTGNTDQYELVDANPSLTWGKCPLVDVGVGSAELATLRTGAQPSVQHDAADGCVVGRPPADGLEPIAVSPDGTGLVGATTGTPFLPWGMGTRDSPPDPGGLDRESVALAFRDMKRMGANTVRVMLQFDAFVDAPSPGHPNGTPRADSLAQLDEFVGLAAETGLYLDVTGLGIEGDADDGGWYSNLAEGDRWAAQAVFWSSVAAALKHQTAVAWYDFMNEPTISGQVQTTWCAGFYGGKCFAQRLTKDAAGRTQVQIAREWMAQMHDAVRVTAGDDHHLTSVGLLSRGNSGFRPSDIAEFESFGSVHLYPNADDPTTPVNELHSDIAWVKSMKPAGQPLIVEETSTLVSSDHVLKTFVLGTQPEASGWIGQYMGAPPVTLMPPETYEDAIHLSSYQVITSMASRFDHVTSWPTPTDGTLLKSTPSDRFWLVNGGCIELGEGPAAAAFSVADASVADGGCPSVAISDGALSEGRLGSNKALKLDVSLSVPAVAPATVRVRTANGSATGGVDFVPKDEVLTFAPGEMLKSVSVELIGDSSFESDETLSVILSEPAGARLGAAEATGTILNDDPLPSLSVAAVSQPEGDTGKSPMRFTVSLSNLSGAPVTVAYSTSSGTATVGADYTATGGSLTFAPGQKTKIVPVPVVGDTVFEADETLNFNLSNAVGAPINVASSTGTIQNDDQAPTVSIHDTEVVEGDDEAVSLRFDLSLSIPSHPGNSVRWDVVGGTATEGADYDPAGGLATFGPDQTTTSVTVAVHGDSRFEPDETIVVRLSEAVGSVIVDDTAVGTVRNDDPEPSVSVGDADVVEGDDGVASLVFPVRLSEASGVTTTVGWVTAGGTATDGTDYGPGQGTVSFPPGETSAEVSVDVTGDDVFEPDETFVVTLSEPTGTVIDAGTAVGTIRNDDPQPSVSVSDAERLEGDSDAAELTFLLSLSNPSQDPISVGWATADGTATAGVDYAESSGLVTFAPGDTAAAVNIDVIGDAVFEGDETFALVLAEPVGAAAGDDTAVGTVLDDDPRPSLSVGDADVAEGDSDGVSLTFDVSLSRPSHAPVSVAWATTPGTATAGTDYVEDTGLVTIGPGDTAATVTVAVLGDRTYEHDETLTVTLSEADGATIEAVDGVGTIRNDDPEPVVSLGDGEVVEGDSGAVTLALPLQLSEPSGATTTVDWATVDGTATAGADFVSARGTATFSAGDTAATLTVDVTGDATFEGAEAFTVVLSDPAGATIGTEIGLGTILDDDLEPSIAVGDVSWPEGDVGTTGMQFTVSLSNPSQAPVSVAWATVDGTATGGADYAPGEGVVTFESGETSGVVTVDVNGDVLFEGVETMTLRLRDPEGAEVDLATATGTIVDDDPEPPPPPAPAPVLSVGDAEVTEGDDGPGSLVFTMQLSEPSDETVSVEWVTVEDSASGADFEAGQGTAEFAPGETSLEVAVEITGDTLFEPDETLALELSDPVGAEVNAAVAVGTIRNDDPEPAVSIGAAEVVEGDEGTTSLVFPVTLSEASGAPTHVGWTTAPATAEHPADYADGQGAVTVFPGETAATISVDVHGDVVFEGDETLIVALSDVVGASPDAGTAVGTIRDDDPVPTASVADAELAEGDTGTTSLAFDVVLSNPSQAPVLVAWSTAAGTATAGVDYAPGGGTVMFDALETAATVSVDVHGDAVFEGDETFALVLSDPVGAVTGTPDAVGTIRDDDPRPVASVGDAEVLEGAGGTTSLAFAVSLSNPSQEPVRVDWATADGSATAGVDYGAATGILTFAPGETSAAVDVEVHGEAVFEDDETLRLNLSEPDGVDVAGATGTIRNDDSMPALSIGPAEVVEGDEGTASLVFPVQLSEASGTTATAQWTTTAGTGHDPADYAGGTGALTLAPGETSATVTIDVHGDDVFEGDETLGLTLSGLVGAVPGTAEATGTILDDDPLPVAVVDDAQVTEGDSGSVGLEFDVALSNPSQEQVSLGWTTEETTATGDVDYTAGQGTVTVAPGETSATVTIDVHGDLVFEGDETLALVLSEPLGASIGRTGVGTVQDNDPEPSISITDAEASEGDAGPAPLGFALSLSNPSQTPVAVRWTTVDATARAGVDYNAATGMTTVAPGDTSAVVTVDAIGDGLHEPDESLTLRLSDATGGVIDVDQATATIRDDDPAPEVSVGRIVKAEGGTGTAVTFGIVVSLSRPSGVTTTVSWATSDGTARAGTDYVAGSGTVSIPAGKTTAKANVAITGDAVYEAGETFDVVLSEPENAVIGVGTRASTITNDDPKPVLEVTDVHKAEGKSGAATKFVFTFRLSAPSGATTKVDWATAPGTATPGADYTSRSGKLSIVPGGTSKTIAVTVTGDAAVEPDETFLLAVTKPVNAVLATSSATGTIVNDDTGP